MSDLAEARGVLAEENASALWPDGFDGAFIGLARRPGQPTLGAFSVKKAVAILMTRDRMDYEQAMEFFVFNVAHAWLGPGTPIWVDDTSDDDDDDENEEDEYLGEVGGAPAQVAMASFLGPEDLPSGLEDSWPAPDTITLADATGAIRPGTVASSHGSTAPAASISSAPAAGTCSLR